MSSQEGSADYAVNFAQLTQRAGNFLVGRSAEPDVFLAGSERQKGAWRARRRHAVEMVFEYILKKNGIDPKNDLTIDQSINFGLTAAAFTSVMMRITPSSSSPSPPPLKPKEMAPLSPRSAVDSGYVPYTAYCAKQSYLNRHPEIIQSFTNAIQKGLAYVNSHSADEIAETIQPQFPETDRAAIARIVERYKAQDTWKNDTIFHRDSFELLENILEEAGELKERIPYEKLVTTTYSEKAAGLQNE